MDDTKATTYLIEKKIKIKKNHHPYQLTQQENSLCWNIHITSEIIQVTKDLARSNWAHTHTHTHTHRAGCSNGHSLMNFFVKIHKCHHNFAFINSVNWWLKHTFHRDNSKW